MVRVSVDVTYTRPARFAMGRSVLNEVDGAVDQGHRGDGDAQRHHDDQRGSRSLAQRAERITDLRHVASSSSKPVPRFDAATGGFPKDLTTFDVRARWAVRAWDGLVHTRTGAILP